MKNNSEISREGSKDITLKEYVDRLIHKGLKQLEFKPIPKVSVEIDCYTGIQDASYHREGAEIIKAYHVLNFLEHSELGRDGTLHIEKEIYLGDNGEFIVVSSMSRYEYCPLCDKSHIQVFRVLTETPSIDDDFVEFVIEELARSLGEENKLHVEITTSDIGYLLKKSC